MKEGPINSTDLTKSQRRSKNAVSSAANEYGWELVNSNTTRLKQIKIDGYDLAYTERGKGDPLILIHGALGDYRTWTSQLDPLSQQYRVISYSRRYHQPNETTELVDYTLRRHTDDLIGLIEKLNLGPTHLVGHSYGAMIALLVASERPDLVSSLTLGEPALFSMLSGLADIVSLSFHRIALNVVRKLLDTGEQGLAVREYINVVTDKDVINDLPVEALLVIKQNTHTLQPMLLNYFDPTEFDRECALTIKTPTLLITGELSPKVYRSTSQALNSSLSNSELRILPQTSHGLQMENPLDFNNAVLEFLSRFETSVEERNRDTMT